MKGTAMASRDGMQEARWALSNMSKATLVGLVLKLVARYVDQTGERGDVYLGRIREQVREDCREMRRKAKALEPAPRVKP
jgi:hypothetical protein